MNTTTTIIRYSSKIKTLKLEEQEIEDILSSISFYKREYKKWKDSPLSYKAIVKLEKKMWEIQRCKSTSKPMKKPSTKPKKSMNQR